jgi:hypothetical protein
MLEALDSLQDRLAPAEEIFFTWLMRVFAAATLVGSAWIDDAPPLGIAAGIIALYTAARVASQFGALVAAAPFQHRVLKASFALGSLALLGASFVVVVIFVERVARSVVG